MLHVPGGQKRKSDFHTEAEWKAYKAERDAKAAARVEEWHTRERAAELAAFKEWEAERITAAAELLSAWESLYAGAIATDSRTAGQTSTIRTTRCTTFLSYSRGPSLEKTQWLRSTRPLTMTADPNVGSRDRLWQRDPRRSRRRNLRSGRGARPMEKRPTGSCTTGVA